MTEDYVVQELLRISKIEHPHVREHFLAEVGRIEDGIKRSSSWPTIMSRAARLEAPHFRPVATAVTAAAASSGDVAGDPPQAFG